MTRFNYFGTRINYLTAIYFAVFGVLLLFHEHGELTVMLNGIHTPFLDVLFKYGTYLGDGFLPGIIALVLLFFNYYRFLVFLVAITIQTVLVHIFKQWLAAGEPRPKVFFEEQLDGIHFVEGVAVRGYNSFPSGHTATGFLVFFFLISLIKNQSLKLVCFVLAIQVGLSRMYLFQHFAIDVYVGSVFGILGVVLAYQILDKQSSNVKLQNGLLNRG